MEEYESYDASQAMAALANVHVNTTLMVGDLHQRVAHCRRGGQRATFSAKDEVPALRLVRYGLADDGEHWFKNTEHNSGKHRYSKR